MATAPEAVKAVLDPNPNIAPSRPDGYNNNNNLSHHSLVNGTRDSQMVDTQTTESSPLLSSKPPRASTPSTTTPNDTNNCPNNDNHGAVTTTPYLNDTSPARFWFIFCVVMANQLLSCFDGTVMASSHPVITSYFRSANSASWLSTSFMLTSTTCQPLLGRLSDAVGRKPLFVGCGAVFLAATVWCALAGSIESFIAARAFCGLGAGGSMMLGTVIISDLVPIERRGAFQAYINIVFGVGSALGAALGGAMAEALGWRWEFGVQVPFLLFCLVVSVIAVPANLGIQRGARRKTLRQAAAEFDSLGSVALTISIVFLILGLNLGGNVLPWSHPFVITSLIVAAVGFPIFFRVEASADSPIMPLGLISSSPRANIIFCNAIAAVIANAVLFNIPIYFQAVLLTSATSSGLRLILPFLVGSVTGFTTGFAINWTRRLKWPLITGGIAYIVGTLILTFLRRDLPIFSYTLAIVPSFIAQGLIFPGAFIAVLACSTQREQAVVTSTLVLWRSLGTVLGVAISSLVVQNALVYYLGQFVQGARRDEVIELVRESVEAVAKLEAPYRDQVVQSYEATLRLTFGCTVILAIIALCPVIPLRLPRLAPKKY